MPRHFSATLFVALLACGSNGPDERVPLDPESLVAQLVCIDRAPDDRVVAVSAEGDLWVSRADGISSVLEPGGNVSATTVDLELSSASAAVATSDSTLSYIEDAYLWRRDNVSRENVPLPDSLGEPRSFCGDPSVDGAAFVATNSGLYERASGLWWAWRPQADQSFGDIVELGRVDGACTSASESLWLRNGDGELWQIDPDNAAVVIGSAASPVTDVLVAGDTAVVAVLGDQLRIGPTPWGTLTFEAGVPTSLSAGAERIWAVVGPRVYVRDSDGWRVVVAEDLSTPVAVDAHAAGGAWLTTDSSFCHLSASGDLIRLRGIQPFERRNNPVVDIEVIAASERIEIERDGESLATLSGEQRVAAGLDLGEPGWHQLTVRASDQSVRDLDYFLAPRFDVSWVDSIDPLFKSFCAGALCHGPGPDGNRVDLGTLEAWRGRAQLIRERLLRGEMPPAEPRPAQAEVELVLQWIEGGMQP